MINVRLCQGASPSGAVSVCCEILAHNIEKANVSISTRKRAQASNSIKCTNDGQPCENRLFGTSLGLRPDTQSKHSRHSILGGRHVFHEILLVLQASGPSGWPVPQWSQRDRQLPPFCWRAALAEEMLVHFSSISKDPCLARRLRAPISRRHCASFSQGGHRPDIQLVSYR